MNAFRGCRRRGALLGAVLLAGAAAIVGGPGAQASSPAPIHGGVVPDTPRTGWPQITNGDLRGADRVAQFIVVGGTFTSMTLPDATVINQPYLAAFDIDTGAFNLGFRPVINGQVSSIEAGDTPGTVFVGGRFSSVNGVVTGNLVKLNMLTGELVAGFGASVNGEVITMARFNDRLFIGGAFTVAGGASRNQLGELSANTGHASPNFTIGVTGLRDTGCRSDGFCFTVGGPPVRTLRVNNNGTRLAVMHRGDLVGGLQRWGAAIIDISAAVPTVTAFKTDMWDAAKNNGRTDWVGVNVGDMTPDGSTIVFSNGIGNFPPLHDTATAFPVEGGNAVQPLWVTQNFDSSFALAVSDAAVYQGGHFCWTESQQSVASPFYWPAPSGNQYSCYVQSGAQFQPQTTRRYHVAALDLPTGRALAWDPSSNDSFRGVSVLRPIDRGLILGHDGTRVKGILVGRSAFFDFGIAREPREAVAPTLAIASPVAGTTVNLTAVSGTATDDYRIKRLRVRIRDVASNLFIQADGSKAPTPYEWIPTLGPEGLPGSTRQWAITGLPSPVGAVIVQAIVVDLSAKSSPWQSVAVTGSIALRTPAPAPLPPEIVSPAPPAVAAPIPEGIDVLIPSPWHWEGYGALGLAIAPNGVVMRVDLDGGISRRTDNMTWGRAPELGTGWTGPIAAVSAKELIGGGATGVRRLGPAGDFSVLPAAAKSVSVGSDGTIGVVDANNGLQFVEASTTTADGTALAVAVQSRGLYWKVSTAGELFRGKPGAWTLAGADMKSVGVGSEGVVFVVRNDGKVAKYVGDNNFQVFDGLPAAGVQVGVQAGKTYVLAADQSVYRLAG